MLKSPGWSLRTISDDLFVSRLDDLVNMKHLLARLAGLIDWGEIAHGFSVSFTSGCGRLGLLRMLFTNPSRMCLPLVA